MIIRRIGGEKLDMVNTCAAQLLSDLIIAEKIDKLISKDSDAAWLQADNGRAGDNFVLQVWS